jgi:hypothetical protein
MRQLSLWTPPSSDPTRAAPLELATPRAAAVATAHETLVQWLASRVGRPVHLTFTRNRSSMISYREAHGVLRIRVHERFRAAGAREWHAVAAFVTGHGRQAAAVLDEFLLTTSDEVQGTPRSACRTAGRFHDLQPIFDELNTTYFHDAVTAAITWGEAGPRRSRRAIQLGLYLREERLIRIHPALDQSFVPRSYVAWIVFHEMLHDVFGVERKGRRRSVHPPEFTVVERSYPDYARCHSWERRNLHRLLAYRGPS